MVPWPIRWRQHALAAQRERKKYRYQCPFGIPCPLAMHDHDHVAHVEHLGAVVAVVQQQHPAHQHGRCQRPPLLLVAGFRRWRALGSAELRAHRVPRAPAASLRHGARARPPAARTRSSRCRARCWRAPARRWLAPHISLEKIGLFLNNQDELEDELETQYGASKGARGRGPAQSNQGGMKELCRDEIPSCAVSASRMTELGCPQTLGRRRRSTPNFRDSILHVNPHIGFSSPPSWTPPSCALGGAR